MPSKIDCKGNYLTFPGVTVVSAIKETDKAFWQLIYDALTKNKEFTDHYAPLPSESYHLTAFSLHTKEAIGRENWRHFITSNSAYFQSLNAMLAQCAFTPTLSIESIHLSGVLQLVVSLPEAHVRRVQQIAKTHHAQAGIPSFFHITLAYQFKPVASDILEKLEFTLKEEIFAILTSHPGDLSLTPPALCFFNNMTQFTPWNGHGFPFSESIGDLKTFFSSEEDASKKEKPPSLRGCVMM